MVGEETPLGPRGRDGWLIYHCVGTVRHDGHGVGIHSGGQRSTPIGRREYPNAGRQHAGRPLGKPM